MRKFVGNYPYFPIPQAPLAEFKKLPISQVALAELSNDGVNVEVPLTIISWFHHISLLPKVTDIAERAFYILEASKNGWSRDVMLSKYNAGYMACVGKAINHFKNTLPSAQWRYNTKEILKIIWPIKLRISYWKWDEASHTSDVSTI